MHYSLEILITNDNALSLLFFAKAPMFDLYIYILCSIFFSIFSASTNNNAINTTKSDNNATAKKFERGREPAPTINTSGQTSTTTGTAVLGGSTDLVLNTTTKTASDGLNPHPVFKCPNDMCRHNIPSTTLTTSKRKICLCGRTMVNQNNTSHLLRNPTSASSAGIVGIGGENNGSTTVAREATGEVAPNDLLTSASTQERISS